MAINLTGTKYSGIVTSVVGKTFTAGVSNFQSGDFNVERIAIFYDTSNKVKAIAPIKKFTNATVLELGLKPYSITTIPDFEDVTINENDTFTISLTLEEAISGKSNIAITDKKEVTITDQIHFGTAGNPKSLALYTTGKDFHFANSVVDCIQGYGGFVMFGELADPAAKTTVSPVNIFVRASGNGTKIYISKNKDSWNFFICGGSILAPNSNYPNFGSDGGTPAAIQRFLKVYFEADIKSDNDGQAFTANKNTQILDECILAGTSNYSSGCRWSQGQIIGGLYYTKGNIIRCSPFGFGGAGTFILGAPPGKKLVISREADQNNIPFNVSYPTGIQNFELDNVIVKKRRFYTGSFTPKNDATGKFYFSGLYENLSENTKGIIIRRDDNHQESTGTASADGKIELKILQEVVKGETAQKTYDGWRTGLIEYTKNIISIDFDSSTYETQIGAAVDVVFGGALAQSEDLSVTESDKDIVKLYDNLQIPQKLYDLSKYFLSENYKGETETTLTIQGNKIIKDGLKISVDKTLNHPIFLDSSTYSKDNIVLHNSWLYKAKSAITEKAFDVSEWEVVGTQCYLKNSDNHITIKADNFAGDFDLGDTGELELLNSATHTGTVIDKNGDAFLLVEGADSFNVYASAIDRKNESNALAEDTNQFRFKTSTYAKDSILYLIYKSGIESTDVDFTVVGKGENKYVVSTDGKLSLVDGKIDKLLSLSKVIDSRIESVGIHLETYSVSKTEKINLDTIGVFVSAGKKTGARSLTLLNGSIDSSGTIKIPQTAVKYQADTFIVPKISYTKISTEPTNFSYEIVLEIEHIDGGFHNLASESFVASDFANLTSSTDAIMGQIGQKLREYDFDHSKIKNYIVKLILGIPNSADTFTASLSDDITFNEHEVATKEMGKHFIKVDVRQIEGEDATDQLKSHGGGTVSRLLVAKQTATYGIITSGANRIVVEDNSPAGTFDNHYLVINEGSAGPYQRLIERHTNDGTRSTFEINGFVSNIPGNAEVLIATRTAIQDGKDNSVEIEEGRDAIINAMREDTSG